MAKTWCEASVTLDLRPIAAHPDEAALIGATWLAPEDWRTTYDAAVTVDIGGSNVRAGVVVFGSGRVRWREQWRYADLPRRPSRSQLLAHLGVMIRRLVRRARRQRIRLAPFLGIGCPGAIAPDGSIRRGGQNLPGNWESPRFNLVRALEPHLPKALRGHAQIVIHNDAVLHGLSALPEMQAQSRWAVLTIGTGLGNAAFARNGAAAK